MLKKRLKQLSWGLFLMLVGLVGWNVGVSGEEIPVEETTIVVHYRSSEERQWALWVWPEEGEGQELQFTSTDKFGQVAVLKVPGVHQKVGIIVKQKGSWEAQDGGDRFIDTSSGMGEVWINGGSPETLISPPVGFEDNKLSGAVRVHYFRPDSYDGWELWSWVNQEDGRVHSFDQSDNYGKITRIEAVSEEPISHVNFIVKKSVGDNPWAEKDGEEDRKIRVLPEKEVTDVWVIAGDEKVYYNPYFANKEMSIKKATIEETNKVKVTMSHPVDLEWLKGKLSLTDIGTDFEISLDKENERVFWLTTSLSLNLGKNYLLNVEGLTSVPLTIGGIVRTPSFDETYAYSGELGALYEDRQTTFRLWAPTAQKVELVEYVDSQPDSQEKQVRLMLPKERGTHELSLSGNQAGVSYAYRLTFADGTTTVTSDPYAKAVVANGERSVVVDPQTVKRQAFKRIPPTQPADAIIYELHVRDFSIQEDNGIKHKGKFLGVVEEGTKNGKGQVTGLDYLKQLGVTHVQLLPMYDYASVDETNPSPQYNWGYDPKNYNVPEGSYSTDPYNPLTRILEMKEMIQGLHDNNIRVIMDVVYNHVYAVNQQALQKTVPGYYFRYTADGKLANGTGVGNDTASERAMMRRYIVDSVSYWAENYQLDGFRFDLMGIHDVETMNAVRQALDKIDPSIIILGEGWDLNTPLAPELKATQKNAFKMPGIAHFNDSLRDGVKGSVFDRIEPGFVNGKPDQESLVMTNILGGQGLDASAGKYSGPQQVIQYVEAHDNLTLYDKLSETNPNDSPEWRLKRHTLATSIPLLSQGVPFIHAGQEFMRTKGGNENSYNSSDTVNQFDWHLAYENQESVDFVKKLIALRKSEPLFRLTSYDEINKQVKILTQEDQVIAYELANNKNRYVVVLNAKESDLDVSEFGIKAMKSILSNEGDSKKGLSRKGVGPLSVTVYQDTLEESTSTTETSQSSSDLTETSDGTTDTDPSTKKNSGKDNEQTTLPKMGEQLVTGIGILGGIMAIGSFLLWLKRHQTHKSE